MADLSPERIELAAVAVERRLKEREAERVLLLAYRGALRILSPEQIKAVLDDAERRHGQRSAAKTPSIRRLAPVLSAQELAEIYRRMPGIPGVIDQDADLGFETAFRAGLDRVEDEEQVSE